MNKNIHQILHNIVFRYLNFYDKHTFQKISKYTNNIHIIDLSNIDKIYLDKLDDAILKNYEHVNILDASNNKIITNINHMVKLTELYADYSGINDDGI